MKISRYKRSGTPFLYTPPVAPVPVLLDLLHPRYLYNADGDILVYASVVDPVVFAIIIGSLMSDIFIPIPVRLLCSQLLYNRNPPKNMKCCSLNDPNSSPNACCWSATSTGLVFGAFC